MNTLRERLQNIMFATCPVDIEEPFFWKWNEHGIDMLSSFIQSEIEQAEKRGEERIKQKAGDIIDTHSRLWFTNAKIQTDFAIIKHSIQSL